MKLVKEHINEKFTKDSDPIYDMGIGILEKIIKNFKQKIFIKDENREENEFFSFFSKSWESMNDNKLIRNITIYDDNMSIAYFSNKFRYRKNKKIIDKVKDAKEMLEYAGILPLIEEKHKTRGKNKSESTEVIFTIKKEYIKYFKNA